MSLPHEHENGSQPNQAYSASRHAIQGAGENVHEAREAVSKATASISNLVSGQGNMVDAAVAVKGAYDNVVGLTGRLSATAMMPVMKALSAFKGQAILPAGKQMDPVMGIDVHMVTIPPSPAPVPMPHPYIGILFNPKDWVSCLINTFKKDILDAVPEPAEGDKSNTASIAKNKEFIAGIAMGLAGMSASVKFGGFVPRAVTGTKVKNIPHIPMGAGFHPAFAAAVAKNDGKAFLGSLFVAADGDPMVGSFHLNYDCWDVGIVDLFKSQRAGAKKAPEAGGPQAELFVPSGTVLPIPWGRPVLVNSIPTPINPMAILDRLFKAGLGKLKAAARRGMERGLTALRGKVGCSTLTAVSKALGTGQSHPVDVSGGYFYTDNEDFALPGPIPLCWERIWYSNSDYNGPLGHGWHHSYDMALATDEETMMMVMRLSDGRPAAFETPAPGKPVYSRSEKIFLHLHEDGYYYATDSKGLIYQFTQRKYINSYNNTRTHLLQSVANSNGFAIRLAYDSNGFLKQLTDSTGRVLMVKNDDRGRITGIYAPDPRFKGRSAFAITSYSYTDEGDMEEQVDALDQPMRFEYKNHLMAKEVWRNGFNWNFRYDKAAGTDAKCTEVWGDRNLLHYTFDYTDPQCTRVTNSLGHKKLFYHKNGLVTKYIDPLGAGWQYRYNQHSELEWKTDPLGNQHVYTHDEWGNIISSTDAAGGFCQTEWGKAGFCFLPVGVKDAAGGNWKWKYDTEGNMVEKINPLGAKTRYVYNDGLLVELVDAAGGATTFEHDPGCNLSAVTTGDGAVIRYVYNALGNCAKITNPYGTIQEQVCDLKGRIERIDDFDGNTIFLKYDQMDNLTEYSDKQNNITYTYHDSGKLASRAVSGSAMLFKYDTEAQLREIVNEHGLRHRFMPDAAGNLREETGFDGIVRWYTRNAAGWTTDILRPEGKSTQCDYDSCGRLTQILYGNGKKEAYAYRAGGELMLAINESARIEFERDVMGNVLKETVNNNWVAYTYDMLGNKTSITSSLGANILQQYNKAGNVQRIEAGKWKAEFEYDKLGMETERRLTGGVINRWQRDRIGRPERQTTGLAEDLAFNRTINRQYRWAVNDRLQHLKGPEGISYFEYDNAGSLSKTIFADGEEQLRNPDKLGNLFKTAERSERTYIGNGQLKKDSDGERVYDAEGYLTEKRCHTGSTWKYHWNEAGMLTKVVRPDKTDVCFAYDALGRRLYKKHQNTVTRFVWSGNVPLHEWNKCTAGKQPEEVKPDTTELTTWVFETDSFSPAAKITEERSCSIVCNHLGTPAEMYSDNGTLVWQGELDSYGKLRIEEGEPGSCPFRYQGQYEDSETGLVYNRFRYYDPSSGSYISQDPLGIHGNNPSFYGHVADPNIEIDIFGLTCITRLKGRILQVLRPSNGGAGPRRWHNLVKIPTTATRRTLHPVPGGATTGHEYKWNDGTTTTRVRIHDADPSAPAGSNANSGWVSRVQNGSKYTDDMGVSHPPGIQNPASPHYNPAAINDTHMPIQTPVTFPS